MINAVVSRSQKLSGQGSTSYGQWQIWARQIAETEALLGVLPENESLHQTREAAILAVNASLGASGSGLATHPRDETMPLRCFLRFQLSLSLSAIVNYDEFLVNPKIRSTLVHPNNLISISYCNS